MFGIDLIAIGLILAFVIVGASLFVGAMVFKRVASFIAYATEAKMDEKTYQQQGRHRDVGDRIADALEKIACQLERIHDAGEVVARLARMEKLLGRIAKMEVEQMAFAQDVLARITAQTTLIGSIKVWIQNLPTDVVSTEDKAAILANLDANSTELSTAIPANVPPVA